MRGSRTGFFLLMRSNLQEKNSDFSPVTTDTKFLPINYYSKVVARKQWKFSLEGSIKLVGDFTANCLQKAF